MFVLAGDLNRLLCEAWLLPTDPSFSITRLFGRSVGLPEGGPIPGLEWGGRRVIPFDHGEEGRPLIWLANIGRVDPTLPTWYSSCIDPFVADATAALRAQGREHPLLAVNVLGSGHGGMTADKGALHLQLLPALYQATSDHDCDVALVTWGRKAYSAAQRARQHFLNSTGNDPNAHWDLGERRDVLFRKAQQLAENARRQNLVLFLGSGVSVGAGLPAWQGTP